MEDFIMNTIAPDLQDGFMVLSDDTDTPWQTGIECVLVRRRNEEEEERAYLSHECRAEAVGDDPFSHPGNYEFVGISTWIGNYILRSGPSLFSFNPIKNFRKKIPEGCYQRTDNKYFISCNDRNIQYLDFDEVITFLQQKSQSGYKKLYMELKFRKFGYNYVLYAPCRYINFPNQNYKIRKYLQPISGYVLYEKHDKFFISYVVSHVANGLTKAIQFKIRDRVDFIETKSNFKMFKLFKVLNKVLFSAFFVTHDFCRTDKINDEEMQCNFFCY